MQLRLGGKDTGGSAGGYWQIRLLVEWVEVGGGSCGKGKGSC